MSQELFHIRWGFMKGITLERSHTGALSVARSSQRDLKKYQRIHEGNNHWSAPNVTGAFSHEVKIHEGNHTGEKPFNWTKCGKIFSESGDLKDYQRKRRIHEKKKPLQCTKYYRSFYTSGEVLHDWNHTGEKPFNCTKYGKSFSGSKYLKYHQRVHEGKKSLQSKKHFHIRWRFMKGITLERSHSSA